MKRFTCLLIILLIAVGINSGALAEKKPIKLKAVQFLNLNNPSEKGFHFFVDAVNEAAKGELVIEIVGGPETIPGRQQPEAVRNGSVDLTYVPCGWYKSILPVASVMGLSRIEPWEGRKTGLHDFLVQEHKKVGIRFIGASDFSGAFYLYSKKPIDKPEGLKGLRFRHSPTYTFFKGMGIIPITARHSDIYPGLERNLFEGLATKLSSFIDLSLYEVCKYVIGPGFWPNYSTVTIMNEARFNKLPPHLQTLIQDVEAKVEPLAKKRMMPDIEKHWALLREKGVKHIQWSDEDSKRFLDVADQITWASRGKKLPPGMAEKLKKMMGF